MSSAWNERLERLGAANDRARAAEIRSLSLERAAAVLEGLLSAPLTPPSPRPGHPVSLSRRMRPRHV